jgi:hypothetical protein
MLSTMHANGEFLEVFSSFCITCGLNFDLLHLQVSFMTRSIQRVTMRTMTIGPAQTTPTT